MHDEAAIMRDVLRAIRLELDLRRIPLKVCAGKAGVSTSTFLSWFPAGGTPQIPSLASLAGLARALPSDLFSYLVPDGLHIVPDPSGMDFDDFEKGCLEYIATKAAAHHPDSPAGRDIADCEKDALNAKVVMLPLRGLVA